MSSTCRPYRDKTGKRRIVDRRSSRESFAFACAIKTADSFTAKKNSRPAVCCSVGNIEVRIPLFGFDDGTAN
jgi:hypothetical protein